MNKENKDIWLPHYTLNNIIVRALMKIEEAKTAIGAIHLPASIESSLRQRAKMASTHYSTRIEGNRLTLKEAEDVLKGGAGPKGKTRDVGEVRNYWEALARIEEWADKGIPFTEDLVKRTHGIVMKGKRGGLSPYREGQNVIRDSVSGQIIYLPPEAKDVPLLMKGLIGWMRNAIGDKMPAPIIAALFHYQFVTVHPYYDGNGRTARLLSYFLLLREGYAGSGLFSLEELHFKSIERYYASLAVHPHHNYYEGREKADLTGWIEYYTEILAEAFNSLKKIALDAFKKPALKSPAGIERLDPRKKAVLSLFAKKDHITSSESALILGLSQRMMRVLLIRWVKEGFLRITDPANRSRAYTLAPKYKKYLLPPGKI